jgi:hypothetical protein
VSLQNRVTPAGEIINHTMCGQFMGNRGILHDDQRKLGVSRWKHPHWIICLTEFRGRHRTVMSPRRYTELFFLDEAVALAAGHRPCAECRRAAYNQYLLAVSADFDEGPPKVAELDRRLQKERVNRRRQQITHTAPVAGLPDGTMLRLPDDTSQIRLRIGNKLLLWSMESYVDDGIMVGHPATDRSVEVLTPPTSVRALQAGYQPLLHPSARNK